MSDAEIREILIERKRAEKQKNIDEWMFAFAGVGFAMMPIIGMLFGGLV